MRRWILTLFEPSTARPVRILRQVVVDKGASLTLGRMADVQLSQSNHNVSRKHVHVSADANNALTVECLSRNNVYLFELNRSEATVSLKRGQSHTFSPSLHLQPEFRFEYQGLTQVVQIRFTNAKFDASNGAAASDAMEGGTLDTCLDEDTNSLNNTTNNENSSITNNSYNNTNNNGDNNDSTDSNNNSSSKQSNDGTTNVSKSIDKADAADSGDDLFDALFGSKDDESETEEKPASPVAFDLKPIDSKNCGDQRDLVWLGAVMAAVLPVLLKAPSWQVLAHTMLVGFLSVAFVDESQWRNLEDKVVNSLLNLTIVALGGSVMFHWASRHSMFGPDRPVATLLCWTLPFFMVVTYKKWLETLLPSIILSPSDLASIITGDETPAKLLVFALVSMFAAVLILINVRLLLRQKLFWRMFGIFFLVVVTPLVIGLLLLPKGSFALRIHHSQFGLLLWPLTRFRRISSNIAQGAAIALFVHGLAGFGLDVNFDRQVNKPAAPHSPPLLRSRIAGEHERSVSTTTIGVELMINHAVVLRDINVTQVLVKRVPDGEPFRFTNKSNYNLSLTYRFWTTRPLASTSAMSPEMPTNMLAEPVDTNVTVPPDVEILVLPVLPDSNFTGDNQTIVQYR
ncbi:MAG: hypothetical protein MHM6MM_002346 [Cercozoa sp. M6MM]